MYRQRHTLNASCGLQAQELSASQQIAALTAENLQLRSGPDGAGASNRISAPSAGSACTNVKASCATVVCNEVHSQIVSTRDPFAGTLANSGTPASFERMFSRASIFSSLYIVCMPSVQRMSGAHTDICCRIRLLLLSCAFPMTVQLAGCFADDADLRSVFNRRSSRTSTQLLRTWMPLAACWRTAV